MGLIRYLMNPNANLFIGISLAPLQLFLVALTGRDRVYCVSSEVNNGS